MISFELLKKYGLTYEGDESYEDVLEHYENEAALCTSFLIATDHIPNKITESMISALHEAESFETWAAEMYEQYHEIISYRQLAREKLH